MLGPMLRGAGIDGHAADRVLGQMVGVAVLVIAGRALVRHGSNKPYGGICRDLTAYTLEGYKSSMQSDTKTAVAKRLARIEGQIRGIARMIDEDRYCIDVMTQVAAVRAALRRVEEEVLRDHVAHCVEDAIASGDQDDQRQKIIELIDVLGRAGK